MKIIKPNNIIPIFFSCDDNYIPFLAVSLESIKRNTAKQNCFAIYVLHTNISEQNQQRIIDSYNKQNFKVEFVNITDFVNLISEKLHTRDYYSKTTYFRLFIPRLYPNFDKALYLDSDIVVLGDIAELYNHSLQNNLVGAVPDEAVSNVEAFREYVENRVGVNSYKEYFNAGILLMNLKALREFNFEKKFVDLITKVKFNVAQDQDYLNAICKGRVLLINAVWDKMPMPSDILEKDIKLIHYNLSFKPWHSNDVLYGNYFWDYAKKTNYYNDILTIKKNYNLLLQQKSDEETASLIKLAQSQADDEKENKKIAKIVNECVSEILPQKSADRIAIMEKIDLYEKNGWFDKDVEIDPENIVLMPNKIDYLGKKIKTKLSTKIANTVAKKFLKKSLKENKLIVKEIIGIENLNNLNVGAVLTCNHFNPLDSFAMQIAFDKVNKRKKKLYKVIREGNYTNFPGLFGFIMRHCNTLPLSSNTETMKKFVRAVDTILRRGDYILIYPEQSMWWNYKKPKPLKSGAYKIATRNNVPIVPCFITMQDSSILGEDGFPVQEYTVVICKPIYPNKEKSIIENVEEMKNENYQAWKEIYEKTYKTPLLYITQKD